MNSPSPHELAERLIAEFDRKSAVSLDRALTEVLRKLGFPKFKADDMAFGIENSVRHDLQNREPEGLPFRVCDGGRRLVGKSRIGGFDNPEVVFAKHAESIAVALLGSLLTLTPNDFEVVCAATLKLAGAREMRALCTGDEGGIDFYGRLEVRPPSQQVPPGILHTTILSNLELLVLGQAKRYSLDTKIGRPAIQLFKGQIGDCLDKYEGNKRPPSHRVPDSYYERGEPYLGIFITTASFTEEATESCGASRLALVTGVRLAQFLAFHGVGIVQGEAGPQFEVDEFARWLANQRQSLT
jgi:Restriction endonuclease